MILSNSALIALALHLSHGSSVNDLLVYDSLNDQQKAIVLQLINDNELPPKIEDLINKGKEQMPEPKPTPTPTPPPKPGPKPMATKESYDT